MVHRSEEGEQPVGGIIIPDTAKETPLQGTVIAAGTGKTKDGGKRVPLDLTTGDRILFGNYAGQEITLDGEEYLIMKKMTCWPSSKAKPRRSEPPSKARPQRTRTRTRTRREEEATARLGEQDWSRTSWPSRLCTVTRRAGPSCAA